MQNPIGLMIIIIFSVIIILVRNKINSGNNKQLKTLTKLGDYYIMFRAIMGFIMLAFLLFILSKMHKK